MTMLIGLNPSFRDLLKCFTTAELMRWSYVKELYESELRTSTSATGVFEPATDEGNKRWEDLRKRVVEHVSFKVHCLQMVLIIIHFKVTTYLHECLESK